MLRHCLGDTPPDSLPSWEAALGQEQFLYFEANLPSPADYSHQLRPQLDEHILVPYLREAAELTSGEAKLEGPTKVDALLTAPDTGFAVLFEAKVISDISTGVQFDVLRNQIARTIDVMLEPNAQLQPPLSERRPEPDMLCTHHSRDLPQEPREPTVRVAAACLPARSGSAATPSGA